jgi:hypothetical protein
MSRAHLAALALAALTALTGCSGDDDPAPAAATDEMPSRDCDDARKQHPNVDLEPVTPGAPKIDAAMSRFFNPAGEPCVDLFVWDSAGWDIKSYTLSAETWLFEVSLTGKHEDSLDEFLRIPTTGCAPVHAELVLTKGDRVARYAADKKVGLKCR